MINYVSAVITARINRKDTNNPVKHDHILRVEYISQEENMGGSRGAIAGSPLSIAYNIYKVTKDVKSRYLFLLGVNTDP